MGKAGVKKRVLDDVLYLLLFVEKQFGEPQNSP